MNGLKLEKITETLSVYQKVGVFSYGTDAVLLSYYVRYILKNFYKKNALDLCSGTGIIPLILLDLEKSLNFSCIEINSNAAEISEMSAKESGLSDRFKVITDNLNNVRNHFSTESFDFLTCNPPYMTNNCGKMCEQDYKTIARHEILCNLDDIFKTAFYLLKTGGSFFTVYRPNRLANLFKAAAINRFEIKRMTFVYSKFGKEPVLVLSEAKKDAKEGLRTSPPFIIYDELNNYTNQMKNSCEIGILEF